MLERNKDYPLLYRLFSMSLGFILFLASCQQQPSDITTAWFPQQEPSMRISTLDPTTVDTADLKQSIDQADSIWASGGDISSVKRFFWNAAIKSRNAHYPLGVTRAFSKLVFLYTAEKQVDSAISCYTAGIYYARSLPPEYCYTELLRAVMSWNYYTRGQTDTALSLCYQAMKEMSAHTVNPSGCRNAFIVYHTLAVIWSNQDRTDLALPYIARVHELAGKIQDASLGVKSIELDANLHFKKGRYDSAAKYYEMIRTSPHAETIQKISANCNLGTLYNLKRVFDQPEKAIPYFEEALKLSGTLKVSSYIEPMDMSPLYGLACAYLQKGNRTNNPLDYKKAESLFKQIYHSGQKQQLREMLPEFYRNFAGLYENMGTFRKAYALQKEATTIQDTLYQQGSLHMSHKLDVQYRVAEKDKQLAAQQLKISRQNTWMVGIGAGALLLFSIVIIMLYRKKHKEALARLKAMAAGEERERTRMARELHDGVLSRLSAVKLNFATLSHFPDKQEEEGFLGAMQQLEQSIEELRTTSHNLYSGTLQREGLVRATRIFCEKISNIAAINIDFQSIGTLPALSDEFQLEVYRMIQELVQNIVKHAAASHALVQITARENWLGITIDDNGKGMSPKQMHKGQGIGLEQLRKRIQALNGRFDIESDNGTSVYLEFNITQ